MYSQQAFSQLEMGRCRNITVSDAIFTKSLISWIHLARVAARYIMSEDHTFLLFKVHTPDLLS